MAYIVLTTKHTLAIKEQLNKEQSKKVRELYKKGGFNAVREYLISEDLEFIDGYESEDINTVILSIDVNILEEQADRLRQILNIGKN